MIDDLPDDQVVTYEDEVDIHLNRKIGPDWMLRRKKGSDSEAGQRIHLERK